MNGKNWTKDKKVYSANGGVLGIIHKNELRKIYDRRFILHKPTPSLCVPAEALEQAQAAACDFVVFIDQDNGTRYKAEISQFLASDSFDYGFGLQHRLPLSQFVITGVKEQPVERQPKQLSMFGSVYQNHLVGQK